MEGVWVNVHTQQAIVPPSHLLHILNVLPRTGNFQALRSFVHNKK